MLVIGFIIVINLLSSIIILNETRSGASFSPRQAAARPEGPGVILVFRPIDKVVRISPHGCSRRAAAGHHHARQRLGEGERGRCIA
jgi:hypothetical protein